jgi:DNA-binding GntR family transcriptional regulator
MYLIRLADQESMAFPSLNTIAKVCCMSKRSVQRAIDELIAAGLLVKRQRKKRGSQECDSNEYAILDPRPVAKEKAHLNDIDTPSYSHTDTTYSQSDHTCSHTDTTYGQTDHRYSHRGQVKSVLL